MKCPHCRSEKVYQSKSGTARLSWLQRIVMVSVRCYWCERRFVVSKFSLGGARIPQAPHEPRRKQAA
jgi:hypothetical protein